MLFVAEPIQFRAKPLLVLVKHLLQTGQLPVATGVTRHEPVEEKTVDSRYHDNDDADDRKSAPTRGS